jgi:D-alanine-D-alanine ligase
MTGCGADAMFASGDKLGAKREMLAAGIPTAAYAEGPEWHGLEEGKCWIVKSVEEDASLGLDSGAVVATPDAVIARAELMAGRHGGRWFAEEFIDGREFNVAVLERKGRPEILPIAEMRFENWREGEPRIVGYAAKWDERVDAFHDTVRSFGWQTEEPLLHGRLVEFAKACWKLFDCRGYARVDFRVDARGQPYVLEINANPCLEPGAGFAAAALEAGLTYDELIECICGAAHGGAASDVPRRAAARGR